ncbi:MAG TPA: sigma-70 family RNA polymerase sigma factor [Gaiellales bacterium]|jgi:RNA polymerase sigma-B factor|nr:sigma-70 family RNA polymerase sigma factor [Gaiellales bacterium]
MRTPTASPKTDLELVEDLQKRGDESAREALITRHSRLAQAIARRYARRGLAYDDVLQSGYLGLVLAVDRYDPSRGVPLERYAARTIEGEIMHLFRDRGWAVRVPRSLQELSRRVSSAREQLAHQLGHNPSSEELAKALDVSCDMIEEAIQAQRAYRSEPFPEPGDDEAGRVSTLAACEEPGFDVAEDRDLLDRLLAGLAPRERRILELRYYHDQTQSEIAESLGISQMHVSRLLRASLDELRTAMRGAA